jgi:low affinity Fe/Cu permease
MMSLWRRVAARAPGAIGNPWTFLISLAITVAYIATGPFFGWSGNWILILATVPSVAAFLLVMLLQYTQNRDTRAIQLKLDELIRSVGAARTQLVRLENLSDEELAQMEQEFSELRAELPDDG